MTVNLSRRALVGSMGVGAGSLILSGCDRINASAPVQRLLGLGQDVTRRAQRTVIDRLAILIVPRPEIDRRFGRSDALMRRYR